MGDIILTRPEHDIVTTYLSNWALEVKEFAVQRSWNITDLEVEQVTRSHVEGRLTNNDYDLILLNGHGDAHAVRGHGNEIIIEENDNHALLTDSIVHCVSCNVGRSLAPTAVEDGTRAFLAYRNDFGFLTHKHSESSPREDDLAQIFKKPVVYASKCLVKGNTAKMAYEKTMELYRKKLREFSSSEYYMNTDAEFIRMQLFHNLRSFDIFGDETATASA